MFRDLHEGILSLFAEAQASQRIANEDRIEALRARLLERHRGASRRAWKDSAALKHRVVRARAKRVVWAPHRPRIDVSPCNRCGAPVEFRQGCRAPIVHRCRRPEAA